MAYFFTLIKQVNGPVPLTAHKKAALDEPDGLGNLLESVALLRYDGCSQCWCRKCDNILFVPHGEVLRKSCLSNADEQ